MAAGMGSRYGGLKQLDPITPYGEFIIDFSIYDALRAGFDKVVFIIKRENYEAFRETVGNRVSGQIKTEYVFQDIDALPEGISVPDGRVKPWGTAHAVLCAADAVDGPFAVINSDDFYGADAFRQLGGFLGRNDTDGDKAHFAMVGYVLGNTLTENGYVSRGECVSDGSGILSSVTERTKIKRNADGKVVYLDDGTEKEISEGTIVSMNCWGFTPAIFGHIREGFRDFFGRDDFVPEKSEYYLPSAVMEMISREECDVRLLTTDAKWYGVTYHEDKQFVVDEIRKLIEKGEYPENLWK
ncbi:MAG: nucleotidyltransferase [Clostridia bacterium]|nr:nucleotidyltransferase [Clostridia bacterium]